MLFIGFPILHYSILSYDTTSIGYTEPCAKPSYRNLLSSCIKITTLYGSNMLPIKKLSLYELLLFQSQTRCSTATLSSIQSILNYLQSGSCCLIFKILLAHKATPKISTKIGSPTSDNFHLCIPPLLVCKIIVTTPTNTPFLYTSATVHLPTICTKSFSQPQPFTDTDGVKGPGSQGVL